MKNKILKNYNKKILLFFIFFIFSLVLSAQSSAEKYKWYSPREIIQNMDKLQPGDILVLSKGSSFRTMWGHAAILNEHKKIVEFPTYSIGYSESPLYTWQNLKREVAVFRLKNIDDNFKKALFHEMDETTTKPYGITFNKNFDKRLYCSQFVYIVFKKAGLRVGKNINLDSNGGGMVMPYDIMNSNLLENVIF